MSTSCLVCCEESQVWVLPPCNHKEICWKCCLKLVEGSIFSCPFCKHRPQHKSQLLFVKTQEMERLDFQTVMHNSPFRSYKNSLYFYSNEEVARYVESQTSYHCTVCGEIHESLNFLKKHLSNSHRFQFCQVCLDNRRCIIGEQRLYNDYDLQRHLKEGELSVTGEVVLYHPLCEFCNRRFYDLDAFKVHLKMGSHLKCEICDLNCTTLKHIYYRNYEQLELHHRKTHYVCEVGDCINNKLSNVFASEALLEDHKRRFHRKYKPQKMDKVDNNILLGFNKKEEEDLIEYDGIGRDFSHEFTIFDVHDPVRREQHTDESIDLREFYPEQIRMTRMSRVEDAVHKLQQLHGIYGMRGKEPEFSHIPIYKPMNMPTLSRQDCERLIRRCFSPRDADPLMEIFFNKRFDFRSPQEWFQALEKRMRGWSSYSFYVVFPMLIRNLRDTNKSKLLMDHYYCQKLHSLPVSRKFIFHELHTYSQLIDYTKNEAEKQLSKRLDNSQIDLQQYGKFLKEMNVNFYTQNQANIYWVSKQKMVHLYHMVEHCSTKDFLKMNWLLKVGLSLPAYELLKKFYYILFKDLPARPLQSLTLQELALLKAYLTICLQAILDHTGFKVSKNAPKPHYLTSVFDQLVKEPKIPKRIIDELRALEGRSGQISENQRMTLRKMKGIVIDEADCPSLLQPIDIHKTEKKQKKTESPQLLISRRQLPTHWNEEQARIKKKLPLQNGNQQDQFPALCGPTQKSSKQKSKEEDQDFPVFDFRDKFVNRKPTTNGKQQLNDLIGFNKKAVNRSAWDEDSTRRKIQADMQRKRNEAELQRKRAEENERQRQTKASKKQKQVVTITPKKQSSPEEKRDSEEDSYLKEAIAESLRTAKLEQERRAMQGNLRNERIISKKEKIVEEQEGPRNKKNKKYKLQANKESTSQVKEDYPNLSGKQKKEQVSLFERIEQEEKQVKKPSFRLDISSDDEPSYKKQQKKVEKPVRVLTSNKVPVIDDDDFAPLGSTSNGESIINKIMKQNQPKEEAKPAPVNRNKGRRRKNRVDESP